LIVYPQSELEQKQISDYLDSQTKLIDSQIESNQKLVTLLHEKRQATINQAVTKGLDPTVPMKDSGVEWIGEIPEEWISTKLWILVITNQLELQDGNHGEIHPNPEEFETIGIPFIKPKDIQNERVKWESCDRLPIERCEKFRIGFSKNNDILLVNRGGSIGKICFVNDYQENNSFFMINPQVTYLRTKKTLNSKYLFYISLSNIFTCELDLISGHGATFTFLGLSNMGKFNIILPSFQEQKQIAEFLDTQTSKIDSLIHKTESQIEKLQEFRQSLISAAVTGKIDVRKEVIAQ